MPGGVVGEQAADGRPHGEGEPEHGAEEGREAPAPPGRGDGRGDRLGAHDQAAGAHALEGAEDDEFVHRAGPASQRGTGDEHQEGEQKQALAAHEVAEPAVDRQHERRGQQVGGHDPGQPVPTVQFRRHGRQRAGGDGLAQGREQQRQQQAGADQRGPSRPERLGGGGRRRVGRRGGRRRLGRLPPAGRLVRAPPGGRRPRLARRDGEVNRRLSRRPVVLGRGVRAERRAWLVPVRQGGPTHVPLPSSRLHRDHFSHYATTASNRDESLKHSGDGPQLPCLERLSRAHQGFRRPRRGRPGPARRRQVHSFR